MIFDARSLNNISFDDVRGLVENRISENIHLEYKQVAYPHNERFEMLRDIIALANAEGGYLILGIQEDGAGRPVQLTPIDNPQPIAQAMRQRCLDNISERIEGIGIRVYETGFNQGIIAVYVPPSKHQPHMVTLENRTDFFRRYDTSKRTMTIGEIRDSILLNPYFQRSRDLDVLPGEQSSIADVIPVIRVVREEQPITALPSAPTRELPAIERKDVSDSALDVGGPPVVQLITDRPVERFLYRYLVGGTVAQVLVIVSPYISDLSGSVYNLASIIKKVNVDRTRLYVITQPPREDYHRASIALLEQCPFAEIRYNSNVHAKLYICWSRNESESFALLGSGNLTEGGLRHNIELGVMISARGYGRTLLRELYQWGSNTVRSASQRIKAIIPQ